MNLPQRFLNDLKQAEDVYEIIALCYSLLLCYKADSDMQFSVQSVLKNYVNTLSVPL